MRLQLKDILEANNAAAVVKALEGETAINLNGNNISNESTKALATALESNDTITTINLNFNNIGDKGAKALVIEFNDTITTINLSNNNIGDEGIKAVDVALAANKKKISKCLNKKLIAPLLHGWH